MRRDDAADRQLLHLLELRVQHGLRVGRRRRAARHGCGLHALRLILAGVFDRFPKLQMIIGHMGEVIPFMLARIDDTLGGRLALDPGRPAIELSMQEYFQRNFHITTSGLFTDPPLRCAIDTLGADKILFAVDHPFSDGAKARRWIDQAAVSDEERAKITHENAERLLGL